VDPRTGVRFPSRALTFVFNTLKPNQHIMTERLVEIPVEREI